MTRPYPVSRMIRDMLHQEIECVTDPPRPYNAHSGQCQRLHDGILFLMHRYGLPSGPPQVQQLQPLLDMAAVYDRHRHRRREEGT